jgi:hypothetical protein
MGASVLDPLKAKESAARERIDEHLREEVALVLSKLEEPRWC